MRLRAAGLVWRPARFDFFHIPDRNLDDQVFVVADLSVDVQRLADGIAAITFNGAVEWSLDYILQQDVVWLPSETVIRERLGSHLRSLEPAGDGFRCTVEDPEGNPSFDAPTAADAYAEAWLWLHDRGRVSGSEPG
jgi:hypothetical protein